MTLSEAHCPTCDGTGFVSRNNQRAPCPTCSPASNGSVPYLAPHIPDHSIAVACRDGQPTSQERPPLLRRSLS
jgi:hypothetical protein